MAEDITPQAQINAGQKVPIIDPFGNFGTIDPHEAQDAIKAGGFRYPSPEELRDFQNKELHGDMTGALKAAGLGAAETATFGIAPYALGKSGIISPQTQAAVREQHPVATGVGQAAGVLAGMALPGGELGEASMLANPVKAVSNIGARAAEMTPEVLQGSNLASRVANQAIKAGVGSATEGAFYGLGQSVNEAALGDPSLNSEKILSNVGWGALLGGALGSTMKAGEVVVPESIEGARAAMKNLYNKTVGLPGETPGPLMKQFAKTSSFVSGKPEEEILSAAMQRAKSAVHPEEMTTMTNDLVSSLQKQYDSVEDALRRANKDIRPQEMHATLEEMPHDWGMSQSLNVANSVERVVQEMESRPALFPASAPAKLKDLGQDFLRVSQKAENAADHFEAINELKRNIDSQYSLFKKDPNPASQEAFAKLKDLRGIIKENLENEEFWGDMAARQSGYNGALSEYLEAKSAPNSFQSKFMYKTREGGQTVYKIDPVKVKTFLNKANKSEGTVRADILKNYLSTSNSLVDQIEKSYQSLPGNVPFNRNSLDSMISKNHDVIKKTAEQAEYQRLMGGLGAGAHNTPLAEGAALGVGMHMPVIGAAMEAAALLKAPGLAFQRLYKVENMVQKATNTLSKYTKAIFKPIVRGAEPFAGYAGSQLTPADKKDKHDKISTQIREMSDPERAFDKIQKRTHDLYVSAPKTAGALGETLARGATFLNSKLPAPPAPKPLSPKYIPSSTELAQFQHYYDVVEDPFVALNEVKMGTLTASTIETLQNVYPKLYEEMQSSVMDELTHQVSKGKLIPYQTRMALSLFLNQDLDSSLEPQSIMANQTAIGMAGINKAVQQQQGAVKMSQKGLSHLSASNMALTPMQQSSLRNVKETT